MKERQEFFATAAEEDKEDLLAELDKLDEEEAGGEREGEAE